MKKNSKKKLDKIVNIGVKLIKPLPKTLLNIIWTILDNSEGKLAILYRLLYIKKYCKHVGGIVFIGKNTNFKNINKLSIGSDVSIHSFNYIDAFGGITIGDNVSIANHCTLIASDHTWSDVNIPIKYNKVVGKPINIASDVWIASGCRILGNVKVSSRSVIGAGAVVNKNVEGNSVYVGVPAKKIKTINK